MELLTKCLIAFICIFASFYIFFIYRKKNGKKLPPGPTPLPLLGNALQIGFFPHIRFTEWSKKYGPIFRIKIGMEDAVVLTDHKLIKELFADNASTGRPIDNPVIQEFTKGPYGIVNSEGPTWTEQRTFTVHTLREFGFGKNSIENLILDEVNTLLEWFHKFDGNPISGERLFIPPVISILWRLVSGERCEWQQNRHPLLDAADKFFIAAMRVSTNGLVFAPILRHIIPNLMGWNKFVRTVDSMHFIFQKAIDKHKETFDSSNLRDFMDHYLLKTKSDNSDSSSEVIADKMLRGGVFDMFFAGTETTSSVMSWALLYLSHHSQVQVKFQCEIDKIIGTNSPSLIYRVSMPYVEAVISEIFRITSVTPLGAPHQMLEDKMFHGYLFRKRATVFANIYGVHYDPSIWKNPTLFQPERFMDATETMFVKNDALIPFAEGKRKCIGMQYARDQIFLFLVSILQQFTVLPEDSTKPGDFEPSCGLILSPKPFKIIMKPRKG